MKEINIDRVYPLNRHDKIKILHDFNPSKSFILFNASLDLHLNRSLISQLCLDNSSRRQFLYFISKREWKAYKMTEFSFSI